MRERENELRNSSPSGQISRRVGASNKTTLNPQNSQNPSRGRWNARHVATEHHINAIHLVDARAQKGKYIASQNFHRQPGIISYDCVFVESLPVVLIKYLSGINTGHGKILFQDFCPQMKSNTFSGFGRVTSPRRKIMR